MRNFMVEYCPMIRLLSTFTMIIAFLSTYAEADTNDVIRSIEELSQVISRKGPPGRTFAIEGTVYSGPTEPKTTFYIVRDGHSVPVVDFRPNDAPPISPGDHILASGTINPRHGPYQEGFVNANCRAAVVLGRDPPTRHIPITAAAHSHAQTPPPWHFPHRATRAFPPVSRQGRGATL